MVISNWKDPKNSGKKVKKKRVSSKEKEGNKTTNNVLSSVFFDYKEKKMYLDISIVTTKRHYPKKCVSSKYQG